MIYALKLIEIQLKWMDETQQMTSGGETETSFCIWHLLLVQSATHTTVSGLHVAASYS